VIDGQKVWTSLAQWSHWCFVLARTDQASSRHRGISYLLVPMDQPGIEIRPIHQITGDSEFNEVFFDGARTGAANVVGEPGEGWKVAMGTLAFERGRSTLGQQMMFRNELRGGARPAAKGNGRSTESRRAPAPGDGAVDRLRADAASMPCARSSSAGPDQPRGRGDQDVLGHAAPGPGQAGHGGARAPTPPCGREDLERCSGCSCSAGLDTIYAGSNEIQLNIIGERALGLPKPRRAA
jgi:hypothetical protein